METVVRLLFERPWPLYVALGLVEFIFLLGLAWRRSWSWARVAAGPVVLAGLVALSAHLVETEAERIEGIVRQVARQVEAGDVVAAASRLDVACRVVRPARPPLDRKELVSLAAGVLGDYPLQSVVVRTVQTRVRGNQADSIVVTDVVPPDGLTRRLAWQLRWVRRGGGWMVLELRLTHPRALANLEVF
ncbi:MAG: hypothetical protein B1H04_03425 [Planctomycetales bacterium 4484_123]|nr:MAG: hypothetical protein B1H04_03425 [Planctomycetales bacterium 4484_123]